MYVYSAHSSAHSVGECLARGRGPPTRCRGTTVLAHWHTLGPVAPRKLYRLSPSFSLSLSRYRSAVVAGRGTAVRYFDTVDTRLISIRYGPRGTPRARSDLFLSLISSPSLSIFCLLTIFKVVHLLHHSIDTSFEPFNFHSSV